MRGPSHESPVNHYCGSQLAPSAATRITVDSSPNPQSRASVVNCQTGTLRLTYGPDLGMTQNQSGQRHSESQSFKFQQSCQTPYSNLKVRAQSQHHLAAKPFPRCSKHCDRLTSVVRSVGYRPVRCAVAVTVPSHCEAILRCSKHCDRLTSVVRSVGYEPVDVL